MQNVGVPFLEGYLRPRLSNATRAVRIIGSAVLGTQVPTRLGGHVTWIGMPESVGARGGELVPPPWMSRPRDFAWPTGTASPSWGSISGEGTDAWIHVKMLQIRVRYGENEAPDSVAAAVLDDVDGWWDRVAAWHQVIGNDDLDPVVLGLGAPETLVIWEEAAGTSSYTRAGIWEREHLTLPLLHPVARPWQVSLIRAGNGEDPPLAWRLTRDAMAALTRGQFRRCIIDAGTALEIAITLRLRQVLSNAGDSKAEIANDLQGLPLGVLVKRYEREIGPLHVGAVVKNRNDVVHRGYLPSRDQAECSLAHALRLLESVSPSSEFDLDVDAYHA